MILDLDMDNDNFALTMNLPFAPALENLPRVPSHGLNPDRSCKLSLAVRPYYPLFISQLKGMPFSPQSLSARHFVKTCQEPDRRTLYLTS